jgi:hypothetical protein
MIMIFAHIMVPKIMNDDNTLLIMITIILIINLLILTMSKVNADIDYAEGDADHDFFYV